MLSLFTPIPRLKKNSSYQDVLVYGAPLLRGLTNRNSGLLHISGAEVREALELSQPTWIDFALLLGSDFSARLPGLGPHTAIKLIRDAQSIETLLEIQKKRVKGKQYLPDPEIGEAEYMAQIELGREVFRTLPPITDEMKTTMARALAYDERAVSELLGAFDLKWAIDEHRSLDHVMLLDRDFFSESLVPEVLSGNYV